MVQACLQDAFMTLPSGDFPGKSNCEDTHNVARPSWRYYTYYTCHLALVKSMMKNNDNNNKKKKCIGGKGMFEIISLVGSHCILNLDNLSKYTDG